MEKQDDKPFNVESANCYTNCIICDSEFIIKEPLFPPPICQHCLSDIKEIILAKRAFAAKDKEELDQNPLQLTKWYQAHARRMQTVKRWY